MSFLRRSWRRTLRRLLPVPLEVVYHEQYNHALPCAPLDPLRAERILAFLAAEGLILKRNVHAPKPVTLKALERIHTAAYLDTLHHRETLTSIVGMEITENQVDRLLDVQRLQTGGTLLAMRLALTTGRTAINLGGGFHHAHTDQGGGFCIFNDVAVAIAEERHRGFLGKIFIVDLDLHDGDGTRAIFAQDPHVFTFSVHARHWGPTDAKTSFSIELGSHVDDATYLAAIHDHLPDLVREFEPRLIVYLAGCDPAQEDQLGDWRITPAAMLERDRLVVSLTHGRQRSIPLVIVLAGGYGTESWRYTARFLSDLLHRGEPIEPPSTEEATLARYRHLVSLLDPAELTGAGHDDAFGLTEEDLFLPSWGVMKETRLLGHFSRHGIELVLERSGFLDRLRDRGFPHPTLVLDLDEANGQTVRIFSGPEKREVLTELRLSRDRRTLAGLELLSIEWLLLQNPRATFTANRPQLPGQTHPGLGMLKDVIAILTVACEILRLDGLIFVPAQFHTAYQWRGHLFFLQPEARASLAALCRLLHEVPFAEAAQAVAEGRVVDAETGEVFKWQPSPMILPVSERLKRIFEGKGEEAAALGSPRLRLVEKVAR